MFSSLRFKGTLSQIIHAACSLFSRISSHFFYVKVLFRCIPGIVFVYITGILKII